MDNQQRIVAMCPWRGRAWALEPWLRAMGGQTRRPDELLLGLNGGPYEKTMYGVSEPWDEQSATMLDEEWWCFGSPELVRPGWPIALLAEIRNELLEQAFGREGADFAWMVDSDIFPEPGALAALLETAQAHDAVVVVVPPYGSKTGPRELDRTPLVAAPVRHSENRAVWGFMRGGSLEGFPYRREDESRLAAGTTPFSATLLGAGNCLLIPRAAWEAGIRYGDHPRGEESPLCAKARELGFRLLVDPRARTRHAMGGPGVEPLRSWE